MSAEKNLTRRVRAWIDAQPGVWSMKVAGGPLQRRGIPDILGCRNGRMFAIELKAPKGKTSAIQDVELQRLAAAGSATCVARSLEEVQEFFRLLKLNQ